ncbi:MAG: hypothetical protein JKY23_04310 [Nitrospinaceae bacterium]|nr:hypothetical protein [Nitrospinaceae bacterium]
MSQLCLHQHGDGRVGVLKHWAAGGVSVQWLRLVGGHVGVHLEQLGDGEDVDPVVVALYLGALHKVRLFHLGAGFRPWLGPSLLGAVGFGDGLLVSTAGAGVTRGRGWHGQSLGWLARLGA